MRTDTVKIKTLKHHESREDVLKHRKVCAFVAKTEEPYSLYSSHISEQNTVCAWYISSIEKQLKL